MTVVMPKFNLTRKGGILTQDWDTYTEMEGYTAFNDDVFLLEQGYMLFSTGYRWDFGTGAMDTPAVILASLVHDGLTELIEEGQLSTDARKAADKEYKRYLKLGGMGWLRRNIQYAAIRLYVIFIKPFRKS